MAKPLLRLLLKQRIKTVLLLLLALLLQK